MEWDNYMDKPKGVVIAECERFIAECEEKYATTSKDMYTRLSEALKFELEKYKNK